MRDMAFMNYVLLQKRMRCRLLDVNMCSEEKVEEYLTIIWWKLDWKWWVDGGVAGGWTVWEVCWL